MSNPPSFTRVSSTREALDLVGRDDSFDFILTMYNVGELDVFTFAKIVKERHPQIPVALLTSFSKDIYRRIEEQDRSGLDYIFGWHGNTDLIMAIIKLVEDKMNAEEDIVEGGVQAILLVEDSIRFYSTYLPELYKLILLQNTEFLKDALNEQQQILRKRATPQDPARHQLRGGCGALRPLQEEHAGRDFRRGVRTPPQRPARKREARRRHRPLPPYQGGQPADARTAAVVADRIRGSGPRAGSRIHRQEFENAALAAARVYRQGVRIRRLPLQGPRYGSRHRPRQGSGADARR